MNASDWKWQRDRNGFGYAVDLFEDVIKKDPLLSAALQQRKIAELAFNARMAELAKLEVDEE